MKEYLYVGLATFAAGLLVGAATERTSITRYDNQQMRRDIQEAERQIELLNQINDQVLREPVNQPTIPLTETLL